MPKYLSNRVKRTPQSGLTSDRYLYLGLEQAEPNLGDPKTPLPSIPSGTQFQMVSVEGVPGERYWAPITGGINPGAITVREEGITVPTGGINSITSLDFRGEAITVTGYLDGDGNPGTAVTLTIAPTGNNHEVLFNNDGEFGGANYFVYDNTVGVGSVGIGTSNPTKTLHVAGDVKLDGTIYDSDNVAGSFDQILVANNSGGLTWTDQSGIVAGAGGTYTQVQYHDAAGNLGGSSAFVFDYNTDSVGIGSTTPRAKLDVIGSSLFNGITTFTGNVTIGGTLTYDDVTNIDSVGMITARSGITVLNDGIQVNSGQSVFQEVKINDDSRLLFGNSSDLQIYHETVGGGSTSFIKDVGDGGLEIWGSSFDLRSDTGEYYLKAEKDAGITLNYDNIERIRTTGYGVTISGITTTTDLNVTGVVTSHLIPSIHDNFSLGSLNNKWDVLYVTSIVGLDDIITDEIDTNLLRVSGISTFVGLSTFNNGIIVHSGVSTFIDNIDADGNLDVDGQTDLDVLNVSEKASFYDQLDIYDNLNVSGVTSSKHLIVAGISTFEGVVRFPGTGGREAQWQPTNDRLAFFDTTKATWGNGADLEIFHDEVGGASTSFIRDTSGEVNIQSNKIVLKNQDGNEPYLEANDNGSVKIYHDFFPKLETTGFGVSVYGGITATGISTFSSSVDLGGSDSDTVTFVADVDSSIIPSVSGTYSLGAPGSTWLNIYADSFTTGTFSAEQVNTLHLNVTGITTLRDDVYVGTGATVAYFEIDTGRVGISSSAPEQTLDVHGIVRIQDKSTSSGVDLKGEGGIELWSPDNDSYIDFKTSIAENYDARIGVADNGIKFITGGNGSTAEKVRITSDGNVGIGITNPTETIVLKDTDPVIHLIRNFASGTSDIGRINFGNSNWDSSLVSIAAVGDGANDAGALVFETQATGNVVKERLRITSDGKVGIGTDNPGNNMVEIHHNGTTSPVTALTIGGKEIAGNGGSGIFLKTSSNTADNRYGTRIHTVREATDNGASSLVISNEKGDATALQEVVRITSDGYVGIGTDSPQCPLEIHGANSNAQIKLTETNHTNLNKFTKIFQYGSNTYFQSRNDTNYGGFVFRGEDASTTPEFLRIKSDGDVGIGTDDPAQKLHVMGTILVDGDGDVMPQDSGEQNIGSATKRWDTVFVETLDAAGGTIIVDNYETNSLKVNGISTFVGDAQFDGSVSIGGTLTYEDVTNIDSLGIITARKGIDVNADGINVDGGGLNILAGISTFYDDVHIVDTAYFDVSEGITTFAGKIGVGENNPQRDIHVSNTTPYIRVESTSANQHATLELYHTRGNGTDKWRSDLVAVDGGMVLKTGTAQNGAPVEVLRITSSKYVGIGTNNPGSLLHLGSDTNPALTIEDYDANGVVSLSQVNSGQFDITNNATEKDITFNLHNGTLVQEALRITSDGNLLLNTTASYLGANTSDGSDNKYIAFAGGGAVSQSRGAIVVAYGNEESNYGGTLALRAGNSGNTNSKIEFSTSGAEALRIDSNGDVGIGTQVPTDPATALNTSVTSVGILTAYKIYGDISGTSGFVGDKIAEDDSSVEVIDSGSDGRIVATVDGTERLRITSDGKVGIGTDGPQVSLHVENPTGSGKLKVEGQANGDATIVLQGQGSGKPKLALWDTLDIGKANINTNELDGDSWVHITNAGNVGIGTNTVSKDFEVYRNGLVNARIKGNVAGGLGAELILQNANAAADGYSEIQFQDAGTNVFSKIRGFNLTDGSNNGYMALYTSSATEGLKERVRISDAGKVGIGTDNPTKKLHVVGDSLFDGDVSITGVLTYEDVTNVDSVGLSTFKDGIHVVGGREHVGIGTTNIDSNTNLHIKDTTINQIKQETTASNGYSLLKFITYSGDGVKDKYMIGYNDGHSTQADQLSLKNQTGDITFMAGGTSTSEERLRIDSSGNIGIGINNPQRKLVVSDDGAEGFEFFPGDSVNGGTLNLYNRATAGFVPLTINSQDFRWAPSGGTEAFRITSAGKVGIGTDTPDSDSILEVRKDQNADSYIKIKNTDPGAGAGSGLIIQSGDSSNPYVVWKDKTAMRGQIYYDTSNDMKIASGGTGVKVTLDSSGNLYPEGNGTQNLGANNNRWNNIWANDVIVTGEITISDLVVVDNLKVNGISTFIGIATFASDVGIADSIFHLGDSDTAIRFPADDTITLTTAGTERLRITSTGHMGLGVTPNANWPSNGDFKALQIGTGIAVFGRGSGDEDRGGISANYYHTGSAQKYIGNGHAGRMYFEDGNIVFSNAAQNSSGANAALTLIDRLKITSAGNVGINSSTPGSQLVVQATTDDNPAITLYRQSTGGDIASIGWETDNGGQAKINYRGAAGASEGLQFYSGGATSSEMRMIIDHSGNVGIGTDNPLTKFVVSNDGAEGLEVHHASGVVEVNTYNRSTTARSPFEITAKTFKLSTGDPSLNIGLCQDSDGKVGIGVTSPTRTLTIQSNGGQLAINDTDNTQGEFFVNAGNLSAYCRGNSNLGDGSTGGYFTVHTHPAGGSITERLRITSTGSVNIGGDYTQTTKKFKVTGDSTFDGDVNITGVLSYDDVTNIDAVGIITAQSGIRITGGGLDVEVGHTTCRAGATIGDVKYDDQGDLTIRGTGKNMLILQTTDNTADRGLAFRNSDGPYLGWIGLTDAGSNLGDLVFGVSDATETSVDSVDERMRINKDGKVWIGTDTGRIINSHEPRLQVSGNDYKQSTVSIINNAADATGSYLFFTKQRSGADGGSTAVNQDDIIGDIRFTAGDGTDVDTGAGRITVVAESNASSNNVPSFMRFSTTENTGPLERIRITSGGQVNIGGNYAQTTYQMRVTGTVAALHFDSLSDEKLKINIKTIENPIETVKKIDGVTFNWKEDNEASMGVIAQNVEKVIPELISGEETKSVNYSGLIGLLIETVKEQQKQIDELKSRLDK